MSGLLDHITREFDRRMTLRRRMMEHLALDVPEDQAEACREDLHQTLIACNRCPNPEVCAGWMDHGHDGVPVFCQARSGFRGLARAGQCRRGAAP